MSSKGMSCAEFAKRALNDGYRYDDNLGHIVSPRGKKVAKITRNGYCTVARQIDGVVYTFCEHRVIWAMFNGEVPDLMVINHRDFDRSNNHISNLELVSQAENVQYSLAAGRYTFPHGEDSARAILTNREAQLIRYLHANGWQQSKIAKVFDLKHVNTVSRVVTGARYGKVPDAASVLSLYPLLVNKTMNHELSFADQLTNAVMGMCGEAGEVADEVKKSFFQGHELDVEHIVEELGDVLYYITLAMIVLDVNPADVHFYNMEKLVKRYPDGFDADRSINRE